MSKNISKNVSGKYSAEGRNYFKHSATNALKIALKRAIQSKAEATSESRFSGQSAFLGRILWPLPKNGLPLMKNIFKPLATSGLIPLGLTAAAAATDTAIQNKMFKWKL